MAAPAMPAAAISLRRLSSRLKPVSCVVMAARLLQGGRGSLSQLDDSLANRRRIGLSLARNRRSARLPTSPDPSPRKRGEGALQNRP